MHVRTKAVSTKRRKNTGSAVAYKTSGTLLSQKSATTTTTCGRTPTRKQPRGDKPQQCQRYAVTTGSAV